MKKITLITISLVASLFLAHAAYGNIGDPGTVYGPANCELDVVSGSGADPCVVINRVGLKQHPFDVWERVGPDMTEEQCRKDVEKLDTDGRLEDREEMYFGCEYQEMYAEMCNLKQIAEDSSNDKGYCSVGDHDGYETAVLLFQVKDVATPWLFDNSHRRTSTDQQTTSDQDKAHIETTIDKTIFFGVNPSSDAPRRQFLLADSRAYWTWLYALGMTGDEPYGANSRNNVWAQALVNDEISEFIDEVPFFEADFFTEHDRHRIAILDTEKKEPNVPVTVKDLNGNDFAFVLQGTYESDNTPRFVFRGLDVALNSGRGFATTFIAPDNIGSIWSALRRRFASIIGIVNKSLYSKMVFARSRIAVGDLGQALTDKTVFRLTSNSKLDFCGGDSSDSDGFGLRVDLNDVYIPVFTFKGAPKPEALIAMAASRCLEISYSGDADDKPPTPIRSYEGEEELTTTCTVERICDGNGPECFKCKEETLPVFASFALYLVFEPICTGSTCTFNISLDKSPVHLSESPDVPAPIVYPLFEVVDGKLEASGARIEYVFPDENEDEDKDEEASSDLSFKPADDIRGKIEIKKDTTFEVGPIGSLEDNEDQEQDQDDLECDEGYVEVDGACTLVSDDGSDGDSNDGSTSDGNLGLGSTDPIECGEGERLVLGSCIPELDSDQEESNDKYTVGLKSGCSLVATHTAPDWAPLALVMAALLGLGLYRRFKAYCA